MADRSSAEIVEFWQIVEMFSPHTVGKADGTKRVSVVREGEPLPWEPGHALRRMKPPKDRVHLDHGSPSRPLAHSRVAPRAPLEM